MKFVKSQQFFEFSQFDGSIYIKDASTLIYRNVNKELIFEDPSAGVRTLSNLIGGGDGWKTTGTTTLLGDVIIDRPQVVGSTANLKISQSAFEGGDTNYDARFEINSDGVSKFNNSIGIFSSRVGDETRRSEIRIEAGQDIKISAVDSSNQTSADIDIYSDGQFTLSSIDLSSSSRSYIDLFTGNISFELQGSGNFFIYDKRIGSAATGLEYSNDYSQYFTLNTLTDKRYDDSHIGGNIINELVQNPSTAENGYFIAWDDASTNFTLKSFQESQVYRDRISFNSNLDAVSAPILMRGGISTYNMYPESKINDNLTAFETRLDSTDTWSDVSTGVNLAETITNFKSWVDTNVSGTVQWEYRVTITYDTGLDGETSILVDYSLA